MPRRIVFSFPVAIILINSVTVVRKGRGGVYIYAFWIQTKISLLHFTGNISTKTDKQTELFPTRTFTVLLKYLQITIHLKKSFSIFPSPAGISLTKLSLGGKKFYMTSLFPPRESLVSDIPAGDGNIEKLFLRCLFTKQNEKKAKKSARSWAMLF